MHPDKRATSPLGSGTHVGEHGPPMRPRGNPREVTRRPAAITAQPARPYKSHLDERWADGVTNAIHLHSELQGLGPHGSHQIICDYLRPQRRRRIHVVRPAPPGLRQVTGGIVRHPDRRSRKAREEMLAEVLTRCPELAAAHRPVRGLAAILTTRTGQHLKDWVVSTRAKRLPGRHSFATSLGKRAGAPSSRA